MSRLSKRMKEAHKAIGTVENPVPLQEAVNRLARAPKVKFDETVELHFNLNLDLKASDQGVRGTVVLPHGIGKKVRVAAFCKGDAVAKAQAAGADYVGDNDLIEKVIGGFMDFDVVVASPDMMRDLSKLGKVLGPRGLMPTPKAGTVTADVERAIKEVKAGRVEFKSDKQGGIHLGIGKRSFAENKLVENAQYVIEAVNHAKPSAVKGNLIKSLALGNDHGTGSEGDAMMKTNDDQVSGRSSLLMKVGTLYRQRMASSVKEGVSKKSSTFVVSYRGISSAKMNILRKDLKRKKAEVLVSKTSVARIALKEAKQEYLAGRIEGQMALVLSNADASEVSKVLVNFAKSYEGFVVRGGVLDGAFLTEEQIKTLSDLPSREVLLAKLMGTMSAPLTRFAGALNGKTRDLISILKQKSDAGETPTSS